jgi:phage terminase Nu1 subunit (DNA packaging protein)
MVREVAYATLPRVERARLHRRAADWLAGQAGGRESELAELVALHYREAATLFRATSERDPEIESAAVAWLSRAADAATAAAASLEASQHLTSAIELARADQQPELHAALADALAVGDRAAEEYSTAVRLGREQGRDADFQLRNLAMALQVYGRWFASVARQPSRDELDRLRDEARTLLPASSDERARAIFEAAEGFLSYWVRNLGLEPQPGEVEAAEASARRALETAERLGDDGLISASLDALAAVVQAERPDEAAVLQRRRLALSGLTIAERSDAYYTNLWLLALLGRLPEAVDLAGEALDATETIRRHPFSLGIGAWGIYALALTGRWDEVSVWARREHGRWVDGDRPSAAFTLQGFYSALAVARARGDEQLASLCRDAFEEIVRAYDVTQPTSALLAIATLDIERLVHGVLENRRRYPPERAYHVEHVLSLVTDRRATVPEALLHDMVADAQRVGLPVLEAEARRALGVSTADAAQLGNALEIFQGLAALPRVARVQVELGGLLQDRALVDRGLATLDRLGDVDHLTRIGAGPSTA